MHLDIKPTPQALPQHHLVYLMVESGLSQRNAYQHASYPLATTALVVPLPLTFSEGHALDFRQRVIVDTFMHLVPLPFPVHLFAPSRMDGGQA